LEEEYEKWGLKINYGKTEYLGTDHTEELQVNGNKIPTVKQFKYLGSAVQDNGSSELEIEKRISETRRVISMVNSILWSRNILHNIWSGNMDSKTETQKQAISYRNGLFKALNKDIMDG
jgi:hypothetical protein